MQKLVFLNSQCLSLYEGPLWDIRSKDVDRLAKTWGKCSRNILGLLYRTHNQLILPLIQIPDIRLIIEQRFVNNVMYGLDHQNESVKYIFQTPLFHQDSVVILRQINYTLEKHRISYLTLFRKHTVRLKNSMGDFSWMTNAIK